MTKPLQEMSVEELHDELTYEVSVEGVINDKAMGVFNELKRRNELLEEALMMLRGAIAETDPQHGRFIHLIDEAIKANRGEV